MRVFVSWDEAAERGPDPLSLAERALRRRGFGRNAVWINEVKTLDSGAEYQIPALRVESFKHLKFIRERVSW